VKSWAVDEVANLERGGRLARVEASLFAGQYSEEL
jgi:hypothetical protein